MPNTIIESLGVYTPTQSYSTESVLEGCEKSIRFPLEKITGIKSRPMSGDGEFSIDLSKNAVTNCLKKSRHNPLDIDIIVCCNISRYDGPRQVTFEPSTSIRLKKHFGFSNALAFDVANACAGMFTGIYIVDSLIKLGLVRHGMVVSGEYITHLTRTAQKEIENFMDNRLACLTLGDAGAAVILEKGTDNVMGFQEIDLVTLGAYSKYCIAKTTYQPHGGFIMHTDPINLTDKGIKYGAKHAIDTLSHANWNPESFEHLVMHQTSTMTLNSAQREINNLLNASICRSDNTLNNLAHRGNSASTSHFVALADNMQNGGINSGDKIVFSIAASGLTVGTALYNIDSLPERFRGEVQKNGTSKNVEIRNGHVASRRQRKMRIVSTGTIPQESQKERNSLTYASNATANCIKNSSREHTDISLIIYCGVYRSDYLLEPAYASLIAGELSINSTTLDSKGKTLAFDIFNGAVGFLNACYVAQAMIEAGRSSNALIVASEFENNAEAFPDHLMGVRETASAVFLEEDASGTSGFSKFIFRDNTEVIDSYLTYWTVRDDKPYLHVEKDQNLESLYISAIHPVVNELLMTEGIELAQISKVFPPQISSEFISRLGQALVLPIERFVDVVGGSPDYLSSSTVYAIDYANTKGLVKPGDIGLIITVGSGIQVGCALYYF